VSELYAVRSSQLSSHSAPAQTDGTRHTGFMFRSQGWRHPAVFWGAARICLPACARCPCEGPEPHFPQWFACPSKVPRGGGVRATRSAGQCGHCIEPQHKRLRYCLQYAPQACVPYASFNPHYLSKQSCYQCVRKMWPCTPILCGSLP
jgi:hypothetical protein